MRIESSWSPAGPFGNRGPRAGRRSCLTRSGPTRPRMRISALPAAAPAGGRGPQAGRRSCVTRSGRTDVAGCAEMCMRQHVASAARARPLVPVGPTAGGAASYSAVQLRRGPRTARGPGWVPRAAAPRGACCSVPVMRSRRWRSASAWARAQN